ncbi:phosphoribosylanthranilate isomerase [Yoonia sp. R2331]|uniref:phosphoribosylanthranilate isomerase n=1 Tax=Yoonia sp. R2331 TaxID=3237238 RepID=UPI0034E545FA
MTSDIAVKICGLKTPDTIAAAADAGARYIGLNFFAKSPRSVTVDQAAALALHVPLGVAKVALVVDVDDATLDVIVDKALPDIIQLHGHETPTRVAAVKARYGLPVMKVVGVAEAADLAELDTHLGVADQILVDAKAPKGADLPGGNGLVFDWTLLHGRRWPVPWMLAGGLTPGNVAEAIRQTGVRQVDVSSGVETAPGVKDPALMAAFCAAARGA